MGPIFTEGNMCGLQKKKKFAYKTLHVKVIASERSSSAFLSSLFSLPKVLIGLLAQNDQIELPFVSYHMA